MQEKYLISRRPPKGYSTLYEYVIPILEWMVFFWLIYRNSGLLTFKAV